MPPNSSSSGLGSQRRRRRRRAAAETLPPATRGPSPCPPPHHSRLLQVATIGRSAMAQKLRVAVATAAADASWCAAAVAAAVAPAPACSHRAGAPHACCTMSKSWLILSGPFIAAQAASAAGGRGGTEEGLHRRPGECRRRAASCRQLPPAAQRRRPLPALAPLPPPPFMHRCASQIHYHSPHSRQLPLLKIDCHGAGNDAWGARDPEARPPASVGGSSPRLPD